MFFLLIIGCFMTWNCQTLKSCCVSWATWGGRKPKPGTLTNSIAFDIDPSISWTVDPCNISGTIVKEELVTNRFASFPSSCSLSFDFAEPNYPGLGSLYGSKSLPAHPSSDYEQWFLIMGLSVKKGKWVFPMWNLSNSSNVLPTTVVGSFQSENTASERKHC